MHEKLFRSPYKWLNSLSRLNQSLLSWFLGTRAPVEGMPQFSELDDVRHTLRMRQFYYFFTCSLLSVIVVFIANPTVALDAFPALTQFKCFSVALIAMATFLFIKYTKHVFIGTSFLMACMLYGTIIRYKQQAPDVAFFMFILRSFILAHTTLSILGRRGGLVAIAEIALFSHFCFGPENMNFGFVDEKSFVALKASVLEVLVVYVYASIISLTIQDQVTRDMDAIIKTKSDFVTRMSHELRTPLTGIIGAIDLVRRQKNISLTEEVVNLFSIIDTCSKSMVRLVSDILDMNKIMTPSTGLKLQDDTVDVRALLRDCVTIVTPMANAKGLRVELDTTAIENQYLVETDRLRLTQVLTNILANAVKFTSEGHVNVVTALHPAARRTGVLDISVRDTGIGMDVYTLERLFTPFEQGSVKGTYGGSGLGLAISRYVISLLGGTVSACSDGRGQGSTFTISLPVRFPRPSAELLHPSDDTLFKKPRASPTWSDRMRAAASEDLPSVAEAGAECTKIDGHVLIAEDHHLNQAIFKNILNHLHFSCDIANNGKEALALIDSGVKYDAIILDWEMPILDGLSTAQEIQKQRHIDTPLIFLSAHSPESLKEILDKRDDRLQVLDILAKPIQISHLRDVMDKARHPTRS